MSITIELPVDVENALRKRAEAAGEDLATFVRDIVTENVAAQDSERRPHSQRSPEEFARKLDEWTALHPVLDHEIDDSRESIYEGRGE